MFKLAASLPGTCEGLLLYRIVRCIIMAFIRPPCQRKLICKVVGCAAALGKLAAGCTCSGTACGDLHCKLAGSRGC